MGADGGTIPTRGELTKTKKRKEYEDPEPDRVAKWYCCHISGALLEEPIMMCELGRLYSRESVLRFLLDKTAYEHISESLSHIRSLKDVHALTLKRNPLYVDKAQMGDIRNEKVAQFICPLSEQEMSGRARFITLLSCGCAVSERVFIELGPPGEVGTVGGKCVHCQKAFQPNDVILMNAVGDELKHLAELMFARRAARKAAANKKKRAAAVGGDADQVNSKDVPNKDVVSAKKKCGETTVAPSIAAATKRYMDESKKGHDTDVFKSLFTNSKIAKEQESNLNNWINNCSIQMATSGSANTKAK